MDFSNLVQNRQSCRNYDNTRIVEEDKMKKKTTKKTSKKQKIIFSGIFLILFILVITDSLFSLKICSCTPLFTFISLLMFVRYFMYFSRLSDSFFIFFSFSLFLMIIGLFIRIRISWIS